MKPTVHYSPDPNQVICEGKYALIYPLNHPDSNNVSNTTLAMTSRVISYDPSTGIFDTENTHYVPTKD